MKFCHGCGKEIHETAKLCPHCGATQPRLGLTGVGKAVLAVICWFFGLFGLHRFVVGKIGTGVTQLLLTLTLVGLFITIPWSIIDFVLILVGRFTDKEGNKIEEW